MKYCSDNIGSLSFEIATYASIPADPKTTLQMFSKIEYYGLKYKLKIMI